MKGCICDASYCLEALTPEQLEQFNTSKNKLCFEKGEIIIKQGFSASHIFFMEKGLARLDVENDGRDITVNLVPSHSFIGLMCSFVNKSIEFSAVALLPSTVSLIDRELLETFIQENGEFALRLVKHISFSTNAMVHDITRLRQKNVDGVMALFLLHLTKLFENKAFQLPATRKEIAKMVGYSKESVINTLSTFNKDGLISLSGKHIKIIENKRLQQIADHS